MTGTTKTQARTAEHPTFRFFRYAVSLMLLTVLLQKVDFQEMANDLGRLTVAPTALIFSLAMAQVVLTSLRWHLLLKSARIHLPFRFVTEVNVISILANTVLINVIGGIVAKVALLAGRKVTTHVTLATLILERVLILVVLVAMAVVGLWLLPISISLADVPYIAAVPVTLALLLMAIAIRESKSLKKILQPLWLYGCKVIAEISNGARSRWAISNSLLLTIANQLLMVGMGVSIAFALGIAVPLLDIALLLPAVVLLASLPISVAGLGVREVSLVYVLSLYGVSAEQAMLFSILILFFSICAAVAMYALLKLIKPLWPTGPRALS
jgi:hypothetical protein